MEKTILFVDNDIFSSRIISRLLSGLYNLIIKSTADDALIEIEKGLKPDIVMSTRVLKGMDGVSFLNKVSKIFPDSFRIFITGEKDPNKLFEFIKESNVQLYINKPFNSLQLLQILKLSMKNYKPTPNIPTETGNQLSDKSSVYKEFKILEGKYKLLLDKTNASTSDNLKQVIRTISTIIDYEESFYFRKHTFEVVEICRNLSFLFKLNDEQEKSLFYTSLIHNFYLINLPDYFKLVNPNDLSENERNLFFKFFNQSKENLIQIKNIATYVENASMLFENVAGTGEPQKLTGLNIPFEIQLLIMVNNYHNLVYRVKPEDMIKLKSNGVLIQTRSETIKRHQDAITTFYKNIKHYDHDLFYKFQEIIKKREFDYIKFNEKDLKINYDTKINSDISIDKKNRENFNLEKLFQKKSRVIIKNEGDEIIEEFEEERCNIVDLKVGDITSQAIISYNGVQLIPEKFTLTEDSFSVIIECQMKNEISGIVFRKVKDE